MAGSQIISRRAALVGLGVAASGCATSGERGGLARVDGLNIEYTRRGHGRPTIVFESGLGDGMGVWEQTIAGLHSGVATFAYSRPGYGASTPTDDAERTSEEAATLLKATLRAAGVHPPYIMVGHSLGGLYIAKFADIYSSDVLGMVFVDARPPRFRALCEQRGVARCAGGLPQPERPPAAAAEGAGVRASEDSAPFPRRIASIPATIIASTTEWTGEGGATAHALWMEAQIAFYQRFEDARFVRAEGAGHYVQRDRPDLVATEIDRLIARL